MIVCDYDRVLKNGAYKGLTVRESLPRRVSISETGCWNWMRQLDKRGYGVITLLRYGSKRFAHRVFYEAFVGPIPDGLSIDHLCFNRRCCNPAHLEAVTDAVNFKRYLEAIGSDKPRCGLPDHQEGRNLMILKGGRRRCRACNRISVDKYAAKKAALARARGGK